MKQAAGPEESTRHFNSFESPADTVGWPGITVGMLVDDPAPDAGQRALYIGGGCIRPAASIQLPERFGPGYDRLSCWGRLDDSSPSGRIALVADHPLHSLDAPNSAYGSRCPDLCHERSPMTDKQQAVGSTVDVFRDT